MLFLVPCNDGSWIDQELDSKDDMAVWQVSYNGKILLEGLEVNPDLPRPDLSEEILAASKEIRRGKVCTCTHACILLG